MILPKEVLNDENYPTDLCKKMEAKAREGQVLK